MLKIYAEVVNASKHSSSSPYAFPLLLLLPAAPPCILSTPYFTLPTLIAISPCDKSPEPCHFLDLLANSQSRRMDEQRASSGSFPGLRLSTADLPNSPSVLSCLMTSADRPEVDDVFFDMLVKCQVMLIIIHILYFCWLTDRMTQTVMQKKNWYKLTDFKFTPVLSQSVFFLGFQAG